MGKCALLILHEKFEEIEAVVVIDVLRRAEVEVCIVSVGQERLVHGAHGLAIKADRDLAQCDPAAFDALIIPGGPGIFAVRGDKKIAEVIGAFAENKRIIGAICAAPLLLNDCNLLFNRHYTAHFSVCEELKHAQSGKAIMEDGNLITANGPGAAFLFALALARRLVDTSKVNTVARNMCY
ncbi:MAG: DJ-1/PfpI family protein [Puniceicoccales bacterium]|jgi:4-methyl-5(b-hydroxyethyl)-thiazole monophosphate biosynthesis|nr:DJ-1/PfpI family protein [Puniceicoccales bacterium]